MIQRFDYEVDKMSFEGFVVKGYVPLDQPLESNLSSIELAKKTGIQSFARNVTIRLDLLEKF